MQTRQGSMLQSLRNVEAFLEQHADVLANVIQTGARQKLADAITALATHVTDQTGNTLASRGATKTQYALRQVLVHDHMAAIARIASAELPPTPAIAPLRMPARSIGAEKLAAAAYGMAQAAEPHAAVFTAAGLPADFIARLTGAADAMLKAIGDRARNGSNRRAATKGLQARLSDGRKIVRVLDVFVRTALKNEPALLAGWLTAKRVRVIAGGVPAGAPTPTPTPVTPTTPHAA